MRKIVQIFCLFVAITAIPSGILMMVYPDGSIFQFPPDLLQYAPFQDFFWPGLLLALVIGGSSLVAVIALFRKSSVQYLLAMAAGVLLSGWIMIQMLMLQGVHWLHLMYLAIGLLMLGLASRLINHHVSQYVNS